MGGRNPQFSSCHRVLYGCGKCLYGRRGGYEQQQDEVPQQPVPCRTAEWAVGEVVFHSGYKNTKFRQA